MFTCITCVYMYYVYMLATTCTSCVHMRIHWLYVYVIYIYTCISFDAYMHTHIYIHMKQFWFVCSMCQTYWAHAFLSGCARHLVTACSPLGSSVRLPTLCPTLVALLPALAHSAVLVCTHMDVRVPLLCKYRASAHIAILRGASKHGGRDCET